MPIEDVLGPSHIDCELSWEALSNKRKNNVTRHVTTPEGLYDRSSHPRWEDSDTLRRLDLRPSWHLMADCIGFKAKRYNYSCGLVYTDSASLSRVNQRVYDPVLPGNNRFYARIVAWF